MTLSASAERHTNKPQPEVDVFLHIAAGGVRTTHASTRTQHARVGDVLRATHNAANAGGWVVQPSRPDEGDVPRCPGRSERCRYATTTCISAAGLAWLPTQRLLNRLGSPAAGRLAERHPATGYATLHERIEGSANWLTVTRR